MLKYWRNCMVEQLGDYTVIDLETTGLWPDLDAIIEVGAARVRNHVVVERFSQLVNPGFEISDFIESFTGITNEMLESAPTQEKVIPDFFAFIGTDVIVGHNVRFDLAFLELAADDLNIAIPNTDFVDTLRMSRRLYPDEKHHRLKDMVALFKLGDKPQHRAMNDVELTCKLYESLCAELETRPDKENLKRKKMRTVLPEIVPAEGNSEIDPSAVYFDREFAFTGALDRMTRREAMQIVVNHGARCFDGVHKGTNFLVLGNTDYSKAIKDGKSNKQKKAEKMKLDGKDIEIISEDVFYDMFDIPTKEEIQNVNELGD